MAPLCVGLLTMSNELIDLDLIDEVVSRIPNDAWDLIISKLVSELVDMMPSSVLIQLTGNAEGYDRAEAILTSYYEENPNNELIEDCFKILGTEQTLYRLDLLQLDQFTDDIKPNTVQV